MGSKDTAVWRASLENSMTGERLGFVEGINRPIRGIINRALGFRDFGNFRLQVLVEPGEI